MKAIAVTPETHRVDIVDHPEPALRGPKDVTVRILDVGVCGTDREICCLRVRYAARGSDMLVIGHESLGEVVEVGRAVTRVRSGDLVVPMVRRPCPHEICVACRSERQDFCYTGDFRERGIKEAHGFMTEMVVDDEAYMNVVPRGAARRRRARRAADDRREGAGSRSGRCSSGCRGLARSATCKGRGPLSSRARARRRARRTARRDGARRGRLRHVRLLARAGSRTRRRSSSSRSARRYVSARPTRRSRRCRTRSATSTSSTRRPARRSVSFEMMKVLGTNGVFVFTGVPGRKAPIEIDTDLDHAQPGAQESGRVRHRERRARDLRGGDPRPRPLHASAGPPRCAR